MMFRTSNEKGPSRDRLNRGGTWRRLGRALGFAAREWHQDRDTFAIKRALSRLSDRRLHLIGLRRQTLETDVRRMIWDIEEERNIGAEVLQILDDAHARNRNSEPRDRSPSYRKPTTHIAKLDRA